MNKITLAAMAVALAAPALAQMPPEAERTVSWYVHHQDALRRVTAACMNDPGHGQNNSDCINAEQARYVLADADAQQHAGTRYPPPVSPSYWVQHPADLNFELHICAAVPPGSIAALNCPNARAAASMLARR